MKKITSLLLIALMLTGALLTLASCGSEDDTPEGMKLARGGEDVGYYFYVPEEWTVSNYGDIAAAYVSKINSTSVTFTPAEKPDTGLSEYFESERAKLPFEITLGAQGEATNFGNADAAYRYTFSYTYGETNMSAMQIFVYYGDSFYIFTYTSFNEEYNEGTTYYENYLEKAMSVIENVKFVERSASASNQVEYERDEDGYILVSDKAISGFELYVPDAYSVDFSSGMVSVTRDDGTNINLSKATYTGVTVDDYWQYRKSELEKLTDTVKNEDGEEVSSITVINPGSYVDIENNAYSYEYTYILRGLKYHVYQIMIVSGMNCYVFTYTAYEELYEEHLEEATTVLYKIGF